MPSRSTVLTPEDEPLQAFDLYKALGVHRKQLHLEQVEDALCELRTHMDEHFLQRKLVRLYER